MSFEVTPIGGPGSETPFASRRDESSLDALAPEIRRLIDEPIYVTLGISDGKGRTQLTPLWFRASPDSEHVEINTGKGRQRTATCAATAT